MKSLQKITAGENLSSDEIQSLFDQVFTGKFTKEQIASLLLGLRKKGETVDEIFGAVRSMRANMLSIDAPPNAIDIVGTGGDNHGTFNVSTATAFVVAACGIPVAKHGNRAATSLSGSSDVLGMLGVNIEPSWKILERCLPEAGIVFLFAPRHHPAMRHVAAVRRELGVRTIFNLLGPLTNPANVQYHMIGVYDKKLLQPMAEVLNMLGSKKAWLVHGHDGLDEISTTGATDIVALDNSPLARHSREGGNPPFDGQELAAQSQHNFLPDQRWIPAFAGMTSCGAINNFIITPEEICIPSATLNDLKGGDAKTNADAIKALFDGEHGAFYDIVLINSAAALVVSGKADSLKEGITLAAEAIDNGAAKKKLEKLVDLTNEEKA